MRKAAKENVIVVCTVVLCFMVTIGLCTFYSGDGILGALSVSKSGAENAYAVAVGGYTDITLARTTSDLIKKRGGAGYVIKGDTIEIVYAVYPDEETARKVLSALGEGSAYVKTVEIPASKLKWASGDTKNAVVDALTYYKIIFDKLYSTANSLYDGSIDVQGANTQIRVLKSQIEEIKSVFYKETEGNESKQITEIKLALVTSLALLENVKTTGTVAAFVSSLRYAQVQLVMCRQALMNAI